MTARYTEAGKRVSGTWLIIPQMSVIGPQNSSTLFKLQKSSKITKFKEIKTDSIINGLPDHPAPGQDWVDCTVVTKVREKWEIKMFKSET